MTDQNVLFGAEWDGEPLRAGINDLISRLQQAREAEGELQEKIKQLNTELRTNKTQLDATASSLKNATNPSDIKKLTDAEAVLAVQQNILNRNIKQSGIDLIVAQKNTANYNREVGLISRENFLASIAVEKLTDVNQLAAQGINLLRRRVVDTAFSLASGFAGGIASQVLPMLIEFAGKLFDTDNALDEFSRRQVDVNKAIEESGSQYTKAVENVNELKINIQLAKEGFIDKNKVVKEYNETIGKTTGQVKTLDEAEQALNKNADAYIEFTLLKAAANVALGEAAKKAFEIELDRVKRTPTENVDIRRDAFAKANKEQIDEFNKLGQQADSAFFAGNKKLQQSLLAQRNDIFKTLSEANVDQGKKAEEKTFNDVAAEFQKDAADLANKFHFDFFGGKFDKGDNKTTVDNFQQKLKELQAQLAEVTERSFQTDTTIRQKFAAGLQKQLAEITKEFAKDTRPSGVEGQTRVQVLVDLATSINSVQLQKSLDDFNRVRIEAQNKIDNAITQADHEDSLKRIENIRNEFERERLLIDERASAIVDTLVKKRDQLIKDLDKTNQTDDEKFISATVIHDISGHLIDDAEKARVNSQIQNAFKQFNATLKDGNIIFEKLLLENDQKTAANIQDAKKQYEAGAITYTEFQKKITQSLKDQKAERDRIRLLELNSDLAAIQLRLKTETDADNRKKLEADARSLQEQIAGIQIAEGKGDDDGTKKRVDNLQKYVAAVGSLLQTITSFWQQVNEAEAKALDRSISLQEKRVENAREIADKGNAEYLEMEQKRLDELTAKREANAQKQLAINQALVLSQALLAAVSAIASAAQAPAGSGPFLAIAAGIAVIGAIAAAFSFVNALQPPVATFFKGKDYVEQGNNPSGIDTVPAMLTVGERVVTAKENKDYFPALTAIHNRRVSPEVMNSFVKNADSIKSFVNTYPVHEIPSVNYDRLDRARQAEPSSLEVQKKLDNLDSSIQGVGEAVKKIAVHVNMDAEGFEASISTYSKRRRLRKKS